MTNEEKIEEIRLKNQYDWEFDAMRECPNIDYWCHKAMLEMAEWKDKEFAEEKNEILGLVNMLPVNETNQTIIEDLKALLL